MTPLKKRLKDGLILLLIIIGGFAGILLACVWLPNGGGTPAATKAAKPATAITHFSVPSGLTAPQMQTLKTALHLFLDACPDVANGDYESYTVSEIRNGDYPFYEGKQLGWHEIVQVKVSHHVPDPFYPGKQDLENLFYTLGGGQHPGIRAGKTSSRKACGRFPAGSTWKTLLPVPGMEVVDRLHVKEAS